MQPSIGSRQGCMRSAKNIVAFPKQRVERRQGRTRVSAGRARDRRNSALADRPRHCVHHHRRVLRCAGLGVHRHGRHCRRRAGQDHSERPHQDHPAVRDRRRACDPCPRRSKRQGRRRPHRARPDHERCRARAFEERSDGGSTRRRPAAGGLGREGRSARRVQAARRCAIRLDPDASPVPAQPDRRTECQDCRDRTASGAEGS